MSVFGIFATNMFNPKSKSDMENPESLHDKAKGSASRTSPEFVNPGTSNTPFVSKENRRTGRVEGAQVDALRSRISGNSAQPNENKDRN